MNDALCVSFFYTKTICQRERERGRKKPTLRSPEMFAPARMPVAEGKKIENMPKKLPSSPRQQGTKLAEKMSAVKGEMVRVESLLAVIF